MENNNYFVYMDGDFNNMQLGELSKHLSLPPEIRISAYSNDQSYTDVWSARLSSGLVGLTSCVSGNRGPKGKSEILLAVGDEGLNKLVELGFVTCTVCKPENISGFWDAVKDTVNKKYGIATLEDFANKDVLSYDARRVNWEEVLPVVGHAPNRIYLPEGLPDGDILTFNRRFADVGFKLPPIGYYNPDVPERFTEYQVPSS